MPKSRMRRAAMLAVALLAATAVASPALAQTGGVAVGVMIDIPSEVTVGQRNVSGRLVITNQTAGDSPVRINQIGLDAACRTLSLPCDAPDPGVFVLAETAVGTAGACIGTPFVVGTLGTGHYTFVPQGTAVELQPQGSPNSSCTIAFNFDVQRLPTTATQPPPATALTRAVATVAAQRGSEGSTNFGTANITVRSASVYHPVVPARILDTRTGIGGAPAAVGQGGGAVESSTPPVRRTWSPTWPGGSPTA